MTTFVEALIANHRGRNGPDSCTIYQWALANQGRPCAELRAEVVNLPAWRPVDSMRGLMTLAQGGLEGEALEAAQMLYAADIAQEPRSDFLAPFIQALIDRGALMPGPLAALQAWIVT